MFLFFNKRAGSSFSLNEMLPGSKKKALGLVILGLICLLLFYIFFDRIRDLFRKGVAAVKGVFSSKGSDGNSSLLFRDYSHDSTPVYNAMTGGISSMGIPVKSASVININSSSAVNQASKWSSVKGGAYGLSPFGMSGSTKTSLL